MPTYEYHCDACEHNFDEFQSINDKPLKKGDIESLLHVGMVAHHLIFFARECGAGVESASFYSQRMQEQDSSELQSVGAD